MSSRRIQIVMLVALSVATLGASAVVARSRRPPKEKYYVSRDIRLYLPKPKDQTGWTQDTNYDPEKDKNIVLRLHLKRPDSSDPFDVIILAEGWDHGMTLTIKRPDGEEVKVSTASVKQIASIFAEDVEKNYKDIKDKKPLRKAAISRRIKGYVFEITGLPEKGIPRHQRMYAFSENGKTYLMQVIMTTTAEKNEELVKAVDKMIRGMLSWKP